ncbi:MAG: ABC transporter permease [Spirochaetaceae bacterium]|nr:MAG: ABC transporter permease [Spirochaetaceae bacterium]
MRVKVRIWNRNVLVNWGVPIAAVFLALVVGAFFLGLAGANPLVAYRSMFYEALGTRYGLTETVVKAVPLLLVGLGICIAFRTGMINIGAEGQMIIGAITGTAFALSFPGLPAPLLILFSFLAGFAGGALYGFIPGILKAHLNVNEILTTVMLNSVALQLQFLLLRGLMMDPQERAYGTGYPQSASIVEAARLGRLIPRARIHSGVFIAILLAVIVFVLLWKTTIGYRMRAVGKNYDAAVYGGIRVKRYLVLSMVLAGGLAGLAGTIEVVGVHYRLLDGVSAGYGFSGIVAALFGQLHPLGTIPSAFFFGALLFGAERLQRSVGVPSAMVHVIQGLVVVFVVSSDYLTKRFLQKRVDVGFKRIRQEGVAAPEELPPQGKSNE